MFRELTDIKIIRKRLNMTQTDLAKRAGVSQSLIAKIESGKIDPTFTNAKKIFETLENLSHESRLKAYEVMNKKLIYATQKEKITKIIAVMKKHGISQLPVIEGNDLIGTISESNILDSLMEGKKEYVEEVMGDRPPSVSKETSIDVISSLLKHFSMVCVFDKHKLIGVITKSDVLEKL